MRLKEYFKQTKGVGVLATADRDGNVDAALYARPQILEDGTAAFIMHDRLTHHNLQSNPRAVYLFVEETTGYHGKRLFLYKTEEERNSDRIQSLRRRPHPSENDQNVEPEFVVIFRVEKELPLIGPSK
ncbi:MAG: pyridoxamine 5'-phosphate oxidase family protein [Deltaproteobacteria bacterium]|nr:pyridoxamine 5'-phosphate oxidase family protein [Deltaproteobacteria bacterium]